MPSGAAYDVVVVGAGPAGLAAAGRAAECGRRVLLLDDNARPGGQIWRADVSQPPYADMFPWLARISERHVEMWTGACVVASPSANCLLVERPAAAQEIRYTALVLATGARERFLPFPGWTLPGVTGAGGLQALVKSGLSIGGQRVVVAGTGPLLLAVAAYLRKQGAMVALVAEQTPASTLLRFAAHLAQYPRKLKQAAGIRTSLMFTPYRTSCWPVAVEGDGKLERVILNHGRGVTCDYLACGFGLIPNTELAALLGCRIENGAVIVDGNQQTSLPGIFAAGEVTGIGGVDISLAEGEIAGYRASGSMDARRSIQRAFARKLEESFALRPELRHLASPDTIVCRCEDVTLAQLQSCTGWREAKLATRCGMGPCQGRICGAALEFVLGWKPESVRPPIFPARIESLIQGEP